jgi:hypothetical protein
MKFENYGEFYEFYLTQHANPVSRALHFTGTTILLCVLAWSIVMQTWWALVLLPLIGYGFAWTGHFVFEKNKPATFGHPLWSLASDFVMWWQMLTGKVPFRGTLKAEASERAPA